MAKIKTVYTLSFVQKNSQILLGLKKRGFGQGLWNGFGGKVNKDETIKLAACRELKEESGLIATNIEQSGILKFEWENSLELLEVHVFRVLEFTGHIMETDEMKPVWFYLDEIPFTKMWPDDVYWLPLFLKKVKFKGQFLFADKNTIIDYQLSTVDDLL